MFVSCALFNVFVLLIVMSIIRTDFNLAVGFGLFALLSLIQIRSAQFTKTETAYVFGAIALAVINGAGISDITFMLICNFVVVLASWFIGYWSLEHSANLITVDNVRKMSVTLDHIDSAAIGDRAAMDAHLAQQLGHPIQSFEIKKIDYVRDSVDLAVAYELPSSDKPQFLANVVMEPIYDSASELADDAPEGR